MQGMEDDQLRRRASSSGAIADGVARPPAGSGCYHDLDGIQMLQVLNDPQLLRSQHHMYNAMFLDPSFREGAPTQSRWRDSNGLADLSYRVISRYETGLSSALSLVHLEVTLSNGTNLVPPHSTPQTRLAHVS